MSKTRRKRSYYLTNPHAPRRLSIRPSCLEHTLYPSSLAFCSYYLLYSNLLPRHLDPILGIATGVLAYHLHESNPRTAPQQGDDLRSLVRWKQSKTRQNELDDMAQWNEMLKQLNISGDIHGDSELAHGSHPTEPGSTS
jgi:hypothetical protein